MTDWIGDTTGEHPSVKEARQFMHRLFKWGDSCCADSNLLARLSIPWMHAQGLASLGKARWGKEAVFPAEKQEMLRKLYLRDSIRSQLLTLQMEHILCALHEEGLSPVVFKGAALAYTVYPCPACRSMGDIDLWVRKEEIVAARTALEKIGYRHHVKNAGGLDYFLNYCGEIQMVPSPAQGPTGVGLVELHSTLFPGEWLRNTARIDEEEIRRRIVPGKIGTCPTSFLAAEDELIQVAVHAAINHQMSAPWLRTLADVVLLAQGKQISWDILVSRCRSWHIARPVGLVLRMTADLAGLREAGTASEHLLVSGWRRSWLERITGPYSLVRMRDLSAGPVRFLYQLLLVDEWRDILRLLWRSIWPERTWLTSRYEGLGSRKVLRLQYWMLILRGKP